MKTNLYLFGIGIFIASCSDQIEPKLQDDQQTFQGVMSFKSNEEFKLITEKIPQMTQQQLETWEKENSFKSFRTVLMEANKEWEKVSTEGEYLDFLKKYDDIFILRDSTLTPRIDIEYIQAYVNRDGLYETSGYLNKVVGDYILTVKSSDFAKLNNIKSVNENTRSNDNIKIFKFTESETEFDTNARVNLYCAPTMTNSFFLNESGCKNDREAYVRARSYETTATDANGTYYYPRISFSVWGLYRNWLCTWKDYATQLEYRNVSYTIYVWERISLGSTQSVSQLKLVSETIPDQSIDDGRTALIYDKPNGDWRFNENYGAGAFTKVYIEGKSRGIGNNWIIVSCP